MCLDTTYKKNISVNQAQLSSRINKITFDQSKAAVLPTLNFNDVQSLNSGYSIDPFTYQYTTQKISINNASLNSNITLFNGHVLLYTIKQNKLIYEASILDIEKVKNGILLYVLAGYMQILMDYEAVSVAQAQIDATNTQVEQTKIFVKFGKLVQLNLFQIESQLATDKLTKIKVGKSMLIAHGTHSEVQKARITLGIEENIMA
jgi:outer membrane protein